MELEVRRGDSLGRRALRRFLRNRSALTGAGICLLLAVLAVGAPWIAPHNPTVQFPGGLTAQGAPLPPGPTFWLGTDELGRDMLSRVIWGARPALEIGLVGTTCASLVGIALGLLAGLAGGWLDDLIMRFVDLLLAFPFLLLAILLAAVWHPGPLALAIAIGLLGWMNVARLMRGQVLSVRQGSYVEAAVAAGASRLRVAVRHVLPNAVGPVLVYCTLLVPYYIAVEAALGFLGLGVAPPAADWGAMVAAGEPYFTFAPWIWAFPGAMIALAVLGSNLVGEGLEDALRPHA